MLTSGTSRTLQKHNLDKKKQTPNAKHQEEERRGTSSFKIPNFKENHQTQELDVSNNNFLTPINGNIETKIIFHWKAKDPTSPDEEKRRSTTLQWTIYNTIEDNQYLQVFTNTRYLHLHQQETHNINSN